MIYLDNNATTKIAPEVLDEMMPYLTENYGNPSSLHSFGGKLYHKISDAREKVAALIGAEPEEIIFTSGGAESNNTAIASALKTATSKKHIVTTEVEHNTVKNVVEYANGESCTATIIPVLPTGELDIPAFHRAMADDVAIASIMMANNETGVVFPIGELFNSYSRSQTILHVDAVQAVGKIPINVKEIGADMLSISGHKIHAPKGVGALYVRNGCQYHPFILGGGHENCKRSGTENVASIIGLGKACEMAMDNLKQPQNQVSKLQELRDKLERELINRFPRAIVNGRATLRVPNTCSISFPDIQGDTLLRKLDSKGICASARSACSSGASEPSHVLSAMKVPANMIDSTIRFSLSNYTTEQEIDDVVTAIERIMQ